MSHFTTSLPGVSGTRGSPGAKSIGWCDDLSACGAVSQLLPPRSSRMPKCHAHLSAHFCSQSGPQPCAVSPALGRSPRGTAHTLPYLQS